jgi:outer membrane protein assembly factor BamA
MQNTYENPTSIGTGRDSTFLQYDIGVSGMWGLNKMVVNVGYDHQNYLGLGSAQWQPDSASENFSANAGVRVVPNVMAGLALGAGFVRYSGSSTTNSYRFATPDATQWNAGVFSSVQMSEYLSARLETGYTVFSPESPVLGGIAGLSAMYFQLTGTHRVSEHVNYSISTGRSVDFSYNGQSYDRLYVRLNPSWNVLRKYSLSTPFSWEKGAQVMANMDYTQYSMGFTISRPLTRKLSASANYQWMKRTSSMATFNYTANIVGLSLRYQF